MTKTWLITGSSRGFGRELTKAVLASGHQAVATARHPERLDDLVRQYGDLLRTAPLDVTDPAAAVAAVQLAIDAFGALRAPRAVSLSPPRESAGHTAERIL